MRQLMRKKTPAKLADGLLNIHEASEYVGITLRTMRWYRLSGRGPEPIFLSPRKMYFKKEVLDDWKRKLRGD